MDEQEIKNYSKIFHQSLYRIAVSRDSLSVTQQVLERSRARVEQSQMRLTDSQRLASDPFCCPWQRSERSA